MLGSALCRLPIAVLMVVSLAAASVCALVQFVRASATFGSGPDAGCCRAEHAVFRADSGESLALGSSEVLPLFKALIISGAPPIIPRISCRTSRTGGLLLFG